MSGKDGIDNSINKRMNSIEGGFSAKSSSI